MKVSWLLGWGILLFAMSANADERKKVDVENLKKQYWAQDADVNVVQNRAFTKAGRLEIQAFGGIVTSDPFLDVNNIGLSIGYHFNEVFSFHALGWKSLTTFSTAHEFLVSSTGVSANTNFPRYYAGGEVAASLIYGKLSLLGSAILYYDLHLLAGVGVTGTETGDDLTVHAGIGQRIFITRDLALRLDYRLMHYRELLINKNENNTSGIALFAPLDTRSNWSHSITFGFEVFVF